MIKPFWLSFFSAIALFACAGNAFASGELIAYKNKDNGFSLSFPGDWEIKEGVGSMAVTATAPLAGKSPKAFRPLVIVGVEVLAQNKTNEEYAQTYFAKNFSKKKFQVHKTGRQAISHTRARWWIISYEQGKVQTKGFLFIVMKEKRAYSITCLSTLDQYPSDKKIFGEIVESFVGE